MSTLSSIVNKFALVIFLIWLCSIPNFLYWLVFFFLFSFQNSLLNLPNTANDPDPVFVSNFSPPSIFRVSFHSSLSLSLCGKLQQNNSPALEFVSFNNVDRKGERLSRLHGQARRTSRALRWLGFLSLSNLPISLDPVVNCFYPLPLT